MSELQIFDVEGSGMRFGVAGDGRPYVVAEDFTPSLGYSRARDALRMVDEDEKGAQIVRTLGGPQEMKVLFEDGIWELVFLSRKPEAKAIKKRVKAILREIRETGSYSGNRLPAPLDYPSALRELADTVEQRNQETARADAAEQRAAELEPAADAWNRLADAKGDYDLREAAQILSRDPLITTGQNRLSLYLREIGWTDRFNEPYQAQVDNERIFRTPTTYRDRKTGEKRSSTQLRITPKGLKELRRRLAGQNQLVLIPGEVA